MWACWTASAVSTSRVAAARGLSWNEASCSARLPPSIELHAEVALAVVLADLVDRDDARVIEQRDGLGLVLEPAQLGVVGQHAGLDHLEGDGPVEADLPGLVDDAHAAAAQLFLNLVVAEVADGGAARQVARGPVAVGRAGSGRRGRLSSRRWRRSGTRLRPRQARECAPRSPRSRPA